MDGDGMSVYKVDYMCPDGSGTHMFECDICEDEPEAIKDDFEFMFSNAFVMRIQLDGKTIWEDDRDEEPYDEERAHAIRENWGGNR